MKQLSHELTFSYKFITPLLFGTWIGISAIDAIINRQKFGIFFAFVGLSLLFWISLIPIKKVILDGEYLEISNFFKSEKLHITEVKKVTGSVFINPEFVVLWLKEPSCFGQRIQFIGQPRISFKLSEHPIVKELNELRLKTPTPK